MATTTIVGNLTKDPEVRAYPDGTPYCAITIAWAEREKRDGQWVDTAPLYVQGRITGPAVDNVAASLSKGARVIATGEVKPHAWQSNTGEVMQLNMRIHNLGPDLTFHTAEPVRADTQPRAPRQQGAWNPQTTNPPARPANRPANDPWQPTSGRHVDEQPPF